MAVPRHRVSNARKQSKRAHHAKELKNGSRCSFCGTLRLSHRICSSCGYYNHRPVLKQEEEE